MTVLPAGLVTALIERNGMTVLDAESREGGMINHEARVVTAEGPVFVKWNDQDPDGFFVG